MTGPDLLGALASGLDPAAPSRPGAAPAEAAVADDGAPRCSRRGCTAAAAWAIEWNNPRVHAPDRVKTWAACEEHRAHLADFVAARGFLRAVRPLAARPADPEDPA